MKAANLLISNSGSLQIADFGLARAFDGNVARGLNDSRGKERKYTNCVVTRWYRPPELLLGARQYGGEVDLWGIGFVISSSSFMMILTNSIDVCLVKCLPADLFYLVTQTWINSRKSGTYAVRPTNIHGLTTMHCLGVRVSKGSPTFTLGD